MSVKHTATQVPIPEGPSRYYVPSRSGGAGHHVDLEHGSCTCDAGQHERRCWAYTLVLDIENRQNATRAMALPRRNELPPTTTADRCRACESNVVMLGTDYCPFCAPGVMQAVAR